MPFVKLDCSMLHSSIWPDKDARDLFITALLMAEPIEIKTPTDQICADSLNLTGWKVPPGWYGYVPAAGIGIAHQAGLDDRDRAIAALIRLGSIENESRNPSFEGRRMVRIDGGYLILNFMIYRERDYTSADRSRRYRERKASRRVVLDKSQETVSPSRDITQAEAEAEAEAEENTKHPLPPRGDGAGKAKAKSVSVEIPENLRTEPFEKAWADFQQHRREIRAKMTEKAAEKIMEKLCELGPDRAVFELNRSMQNGWRGIFPDSKNGISRSVPKYPHVEESSFSAEGM